ncbi:MAG TPA: hypothetical protein VNZ22_03515 [Bacillota bacterium]|nr:hypothetical protein [Bacillota bacterium]
MADASQPTLYTELDTVQIQGSIHPRLTYLWCYATSEPQRGEVALQGIRLTLNSAGQPVVWEVLTDESGKELIFVAESLEAAARAEHGQPLPGRRYVIERELEEAPKVVVARVIDDGPMSMGPMVYLRAGTHSVNTVICRCMPAQAKTVAAARTYHLSPAQAAFSHSLVGRARAQVRGQIAFWPGEKAGEKRLEQCLRLPAKF